MQIHNTDGAKIIILAAFGLLMFSCSNAVANVDKIAATIIRLNQHNINLSISSVGTTIGVNIIPDNTTDKSTIWSSSNSNIVAVDSTGYITPKSIGKTTIYVRTNNGKYDYSQVIVTPPLYLMGNMLYNGNIQPFFLLNNVTTILRSPYNLSLCNTSQMIATSIDRYISGSISGFNMKSEACIWQNEYITILSKYSTLGDGYANGLADTGQLFVSGFTSNSTGIYYPCIWKNGIRTDLPVLDNARGGVAYGIFATDSSILVAGSSINSLGVNIPCYWNNGEMTILSVSDTSKGGEARNVSIVNSDIYITGIIWTNVNMYNTDGTLAYTKTISNVCVWKNGTLAVLPAADPTSGSTIVNGLKVINNDVYIYGATGGGFTTPCYWINGTRVDLPISQNYQYGMSGQVSGISTSNGEVFPVGFSRPSFDSDGAACFWTNGEKIDIDPPINELGYGYFPSTAYSQ